MARMLATRVPAFAPRSPSTRSTYYNEHEEGDDSAYRAPQYVRTSHAFFLALFFTIFQVSLASPPALASVVDILQGHARDRYY